VQTLQRSQGTSSGQLIISSTRLDAQGTTLRDLVSKAYDTPSVLIFNLDPQLADTRYDIVATYEPKNGESISPHELLRNLLTARFGITAHKETHVLAVYALTVAPAGIHFASASEKGGIESNDHSFAGHGVTMDFVATDLSGTTNAIVINRTSLPGRYDLRFTWQPGSDMASTIVAIRQAAEQQLGLKLEPTQAPVQALVVDHIEVASR
jgi:uncharacterized protein (TIGR03435 family)